MFKLLSKESNIFSIPVYIGFLFFLIFIFNILNFNHIEFISETITFLGIALGYFLFNKINLNRQTHLPLFFYTFFVFALYPGNLDIGLSIALLSNSFLLLILTNSDDKLRKNSFVIVGVLLAINFIFLPTTWPLLLFVIVHIIATSSKIGLNIFRLFFGITLIAISYLLLSYSFNYRIFDDAYLPFSYFKPQEIWYPLILLIPIAIFLIIAIVSHFIHINEKSLENKYKYTFLLTFSAAQLVTIILYMNQNHEYLLLLSLPVSIILGRYVTYLPKYWMKEISVWIIIFTLLIYKLGAYFDLAHLIFI